MNRAIYIGPYRQYDYHGILSDILLKSILKNLNNKYTVNSRPLYLDSSLISQYSNDTYYNTEIIPDNVVEYSTIIQHCPVEYIAIQKKWKNICIPIFDPKLFKASNYSTVQRLNLVDHILVGSEYYKQFLLRSGISTPISVYEENFHEYINQEILQKRYNFGSIENNRYNFGFIGSYIKNLQVIKKIIMAFVNAHRADDNYRLVFFLRGSQNDKNDIEKFYNETRKNLNLSNFDSIFFIFGPLDTDNSILCLNSIDCLLSINDDYTNELYETYILKQNKRILSRGNLNIINVPPSSSDMYDIEDEIGSISTDSLIKKMINIDKQQNYKNKKNNKINNTAGQIICRILS